MSRPVKETLADLDRMAVEAERLNNWLAGWYFGKETFEASYESALKRVMDDLDKPGQAIALLIGADRKELVDGIRRYLTGVTIESRDIPQTSPTEGSPW